MRFRALDYGEDAVGPRPFRIFAALLHRTLGDFTDQLLFAASVAEMFPNARLDVYFRDDRPYKSEIVRLAPQVSSVWPSSNPMPIDLFDTAGRRPVPGPEAWHAAGCDEPDLLLTPSMCGREKLGYFDPLARFQVPERDEWDNQLRRAVGDMGFCVLHYRESGYEFGRAGEVRNITAQDVEPVVDLLLRRGVGVVRVGHPEMTPLRQREGYVDLSAAAFMLQVCAISHARFFMEVSPSGPYAIANGFGVPVARCNALILSGPATSQSIVLARPILNAGGEVVTSDALASGLDPARFIDANPDHRLGANSFEQIEAVAEEMLDATADIAGWRDQPEANANRSAARPFTWPIPRRARHRVAI